MHKKKKWHLTLILAVAALTVYNTLPTVIFYTKPLKESVGEERANEISAQVADRINSLEDESVQWLTSFCDLLQVKPLKIALSKENPERINISFTDARDAQTLRTYLPRAGALISFTPAQLSLYGDPSQGEETVVTVKRTVPVHIEKDSLSANFQFSKKFDENGSPTALYRALTFDRVGQIALAATGSGSGRLVEALFSTEDPMLSLDISLAISDSIVSYTKAFGQQKDLLARFFNSLTETASPKDLRDKINTSAVLVADNIDMLAKEEARLKESGNFLDPAKVQMKTSLSQKKKILRSAATFLESTEFANSTKSERWSSANITSIVQAGTTKVEGSDLEVLSLKGKNPFIEAIQIDWRNETVSLKLFDEVLDHKAQLAKDNPRALEDVEQILFNEVATIGRFADEEIKLFQEEYQIALSDLSDSKGFLAFKLTGIAKAQIEGIKDLLSSAWHPRHADLQANVFPVIDYDTYLSLPVEEKGLSLVLYAPANSTKAPATGFRTNSVYVVAKGMDKIIKKFQEDPTAADAKVFIEDFQKLRSLLSFSGYVGYEASPLHMAKEFAGDFIFEAPDYYQNVLTASREDFVAKGTKKYALLELASHEQRILTENKIDTAIHEDLLKWRDDYRAAQLNIKGVSHFDVPKPTKSIFMSNIKLSARKYFRGDDRKVLRWGLDLSGGKTVQIELRDTNNKLVTHEADIKQGINELYRRVNKMGVSEVSIRQEGDLITLDFPGSQSLSANDLIKASSMQFHLVNEKFSPRNGALGEPSNRFLQEVWNEAVVTGKKSSEELNTIACKHLYGDELNTEVPQPRTSSAKSLYDQGLRLALPSDYATSTEFNETYSKISLFRGEDYTDWQEQTHPLVIVFKNFALEGSDLENVRAAYDPSRGNFLSFEVRSSYTSKEGIKVAPRDDFFAWTSPFSKDKISGTTAGQISQNQGWRMAVILNGSIVSSPALHAALKDSAMITGSFSQREINQLESDLKAGSLSYTPKILSEKNVSPDLGAKERSFGIWATVIALLLVIGVMSWYYRLAGVIASIAVLFNILIMWATLQNIQATLTLASLAGLILTVGMAVDANVLVFERIREELSVTGKLSSAIRAGYKKAFSAILDSNVTTVIAALILLQFDSGPVKGFAVTLIIGLVSSMFTALFVTRFLFGILVKNPKREALSMMNLFKAKKFNFLRFGKAAMISSAVVMVLGGSLFITKRHAIFGMDFTGGYAMNVDLNPVEDLPYRQVVENALVASGAKPQEIQVRELSPSNSVKIFLSKNLSTEGRPLHNLQGSSEAGTNPQIDWVLSALKTANVSLTKDSSTAATQNWSEVSGQMSKTMRNSALTGLLIALFCIFLYITIRFEFTYAISATACLAHDLLFTLGAIGLLHALGVTVQMDLTTVAALMTIAGYSLNDTIIVFDRIREETKGMRKANLPKVINHALNITLSRTVLTSGTTLVALLPLIALGGSTIFSFTLVMAIGVVFGTLSSLFIAAPLMLMFHKREERKQQRIALNS